MSSTHLTGAPLVQRVNELAAACVREAADAYERAPGQEQDVVALMLVDAGVYAKTSLMDALRTELGLPDPVVPSAREHAELSRRLYAAHDHGTAPQTTPIVHAMNKPRPPSRGPRLA